MANIVIVLELAKRAELIHISPALKKLNIRVLFYIRKKVTDVLVYTGLIAEVHVPLPGDRKTSR